MSDYKGIFASEDIGVITAHSSGIYSVCVVKRSNTNEVLWRGEVEATSARKAQQKWREQFPDMRARYDHSHALLISRVCSLQKK